MAGLIHVLHVENTRLYRGVVRHVLEREGGYQVTEAVNRAEFAARLQQGPYDLVLSDLDMVDITGLEVIDAIHKQWPDVPVIIVTGTGSEEVAVEAMKRGAADYVLKNPKHIQHLPFAVAAALEKARLDRQRRDMETALRESEQRNRVISEMTSDYVYVYRLEPDGRLVNEWLSDSVYRIIGYTPEQYRALSGGLDTIHPDDRPFAEAMVERILAGETVTFELRVVTEQGTVRWLRNWAQPRWDAGHQRVIGFIGAAQDITERKEAEDALRASEQHHRHVLESLPVAVYLADSEGRLTMYNQAAADLWGRRPVLGEEKWYGSLKLFTADGMDLPHDSCPMAIALREGRPAQGVEVQAERPDGTRVAFLANITPFFDPAGNVTGAMNVLVDITDRKRAETELRRGEARLRAILDTEPECVKLLAADGSVLQMNAAGLRMIEADSFQQIENCCIYSLVAEEDRRAFQELTEKVFAGQSGTLEFQFIGLKGRRRWLETHASPLRDATGQVTAFLGVTRDITERKLAEQALRESHDRLRALSRRVIEVQEAERRKLARELHDEIGQVLTAVHISIEQLRQSCPTACPRFDKCEQMINRAIGQVRSMSLNLRPAMLDDFGLVPALRWFLEGQKEQSGLEITLEAVSDGLPLPQEVANTAYRIVQESLTNVQRHARARHVWVTVRQDETELRLSIRDDGVGFDPGAALQRATAGASFGLLNMRERIKLLGGRFALESAPGQGTTVRIALPLPADQDEDESRAEAGGSP
jgi:PAS domain S-box-containing protein